MNSSQTLQQKFELKKLAKLLGIPRPHALGCLHYLWYWAIDEAPDGDISHLDAEAVALICEWDDDPDAFLQAMIDSQWITEDMHLGLWDETGGQTIKRRDQWRESQRKRRETHARVSYESTDSHVDNTLTTDESPESQLESSPTVHDLTDTRHNTTKDKIPRAFLSSASRHDAEQLTEYLAESITLVSPTHKLPDDLTKWFVDMDQLLRIDGRSVDEVRQLLAYIRSHEFWKTVVQSPAGLRKNYDKILPQYRQDHSQRNGTQETTDEYLDRIDASYRRKAAEKGEILE